MSKFPSAMKSRFHEFIDPLPFETKEEGGDESTRNGKVFPSEYLASCSSSGNSGDHVLSPSVNNKEMGLGWSIPCLLISASLSIVTSPILAPHLKHWIWNWGQVLFAHFCCVLVSRFIVACCVLRTRASSMHFALHCLTHSLFATAWFSLLTILVSQDFVVDFYFENLRTLVYMLMAAQVGFDVFRSIYVHWMFKPRMREAASHLYVLEALTGPPLSEDKREKMKADPASGPLKKFEQMSMASFSMDGLLVLNFPGFLVEVADMLLILRPSRTNSRVRDAVDRYLWARIDGSAESMFKSNRQSEIVEEARRAFQHVASPGNRQDVSGFLTEDNVKMVHTLIAKTFGAGKIDELEFQEWVVETYRLRKSLVHAITDTKIMMSNLYRFGMTSISVMFLMPCLVEGVKPAAVLVSFIPLVCLLCYVFRETVESFFDSLLFVFVAHPFDVGDCCEIDGAQMIVEEMNIWNTVFLGFNRGKIQYPNSQLLAKPINNYNRNSDIGEKIEFLIDASTPDKTVDDLRTDIKVYLKMKGKYWQENHSLLMEGIEEGMLKMNLNIVHRMNYHNFPEMKKHRSELLFALKDIFGRLNIKGYVFRRSPTPEDPPPNLGSKTQASYSNTEMLPKPISNYSQTSDMSDKIEFSIDVSTPDETVRKLMSRVEMHFKEKNKNLQVKHLVSPKETEDGKMKINLSVLPETNYLSCRDRRKRRSDLFRALKNSCESLGISLLRLSTGAVDAYSKQEHLSPIKPHLTRRKSF